MNVALIFGAGASVAEALSHRPVQTREHPPLDTNFFSKVAELDRAFLRASLVSTTAVLGLRDPFKPPEPRMEEFFGDIYFELVESDDRQREIALSAYRTLLRMYARALAQTTNWFYDRPLGVIGRLLRTLLAVEELSKLSLVTFNHDLVLENAVCQLPYRQRWCVDRGYGPIDLAPTGTSRRVPRLPEHSDLCDHSVPIEILKLHGSLNWQVMTRSHEPSFRDLFPPIDSGTRIECITDRRASVTLERLVGNRRWRLWPQIVPPIYHKMDIVTARFGQLWRHASLSLEAADAIVLLGYSLPPADVHAANLIKRGIRRNAKVSRIDVVNPDSGVAAKLADVREVTALRWFEQLGGYIDDVAAHGL